MYLLEYLKHGDLVSIVDAVKYLLFKKSHKKDRIVKNHVKRLQDLGYTVELKKAAA